MAGPFGTPTPELFFGACPKDPMPSSKWRSVEVRPISAGGSSAGSVRSMFVSFFSALYSSVLTCPYFDTLFTFLLPVAEPAQSD